MISLDFDLLMEDDYSLTPDLYLCIKAYKSLGFDVMMNYFGQVYVDVKNSLVYIGKINFNSILD